MLTAARCAAVLGSPIGHSLSPALHRAAYSALGLSGWRYEAHEVQGPELRDFVVKLGPEWVGLSLTMPLKEAAFEIADEVSDLAREVGAINTLVCRTDGGWSGENTDVYGVSQALREAGCDHVGSALVLGSGATARSVVAALAMLGAQRVTFAVRSRARPKTLEHARRAGLDVDVVGLGRVADRVAGVPLVISTVPAQALQAAALLGKIVPEGSSIQGHLLLDVVYAGWPTALARDFQEAGARVVSGLEVLVHQAAAQVQLMTGLPAPVSQMRAAGLAALGSP